MLSLLKWDIVRGIGNSKVAKISIVMPFIGYLLIFNRYILDAFRDLLDEGSRLDTGLLENYPAFIYNMYILYLGFLAFGIASIVYQLFCDKIIKQFDSENEFAAFRITVSTLEDLNACCSYIIKSRGYNKTEDSSFDLINKVIESGTNKDINASARLSVYKKYYQLKNTCNYSALFVSFFLYITGILLVSIPAVKTSFKVVATLIG